MFNNIKLRKLRMDKTLLNVLSGILFLSTTIAWAAGDPELGKQKAQACAVCHGPGGNSATPMWPNLAGQHADYTHKQLMDFRSGKRDNAQMSPMAAPLSDADIENIAAYYAAQQAKIGTTSPEHLELGERLYRAGNAKTGLAACMACHGPRGSGNPAAKYPALSGQHADYTAAQLRAFKSEVRSNDLNNIMRSTASKMTNAEIEAVSSYIQGLH
ncbi:MAG: c-type cytochrome [Gammaproteobacteria bacterium]|nr:c-type cytochrome [Gammaproteobacteria bacterium]